MGETLLIQSLKRGAGRPRSVPQELLRTVFRLYSAGYGYRAIADALIAQGAFTRKSSVERVIKGLPPNQGRRVVGTQL